MKNNIIFEISKEESGAYSAEAVDYFIVTQGNTLDELMNNIEEATFLYFESENKDKTFKIPSITLKFLAHA